MLKVSSHAALGANRRNWRSVFHCSATVSLQSQRCAIAQTVQQRLDTGSVGRTGWENEERELLSM